MEKGDGLLAELLVVAGRPWAMLPASLELLASALQGGVVLAGPFDEFEDRAQKHGGVAVVPLTGVVTPQGGGALGALLGMGGGLGEFRKGLARALADPTVDSIVLDVNSPGGLTDRVPETAALVRTAREHKPITAVANTMAASAAYWIASQADEVVAAPSGELGAIGTYMLHTDKSAELEKQGVNVTITSAGRYKTEGNVYGPLSDEAADARQRKVDLFYEKFVSDVARGRRTSVNEIVDGYGEGRTLLAEAAVDAGLADRVGTLEEVVADAGGHVPQRRIVAEEEPEQSEEEIAKIAAEAEEAAAQRAEMLADALFDVGVEAAKFDESKAKRDRGGRFAKRDVAEEERRANANAAAERAEIFLVG